MSGHMNAPSAPPFVLHDPKHIEPEKSRLAAVPDMFRYEVSFLKSIQQFVSFAPRERPELEIQWARVGWVTVRDQVLSPFAQGALWAIVGYLFAPLAQSFIPRRTGEGGLVKWLRGFVQPLRPQAPTRA